MNIIAHHSAEQRHRRRTIAKSGDSGATKQNIQDPADALARADVARYVAEISAELANLAGRARLESLAYLLSMARLEAELASRAGGRDKTGV